MGWGWDGVGMGVLGWGEIGGFACLLESRRFAVRGGFVSDMRITIVMEADLHSRKEMVHAAT